MKGSASRLTRSVSLHSHSKQQGFVELELVIGGLGRRFFHLLEAIDELGSIVSAAKASGLSYKGAWDMIERASARSPRPLIERNAGGGQERGTRLTETGKAFVSFYKATESKKQRFLEEVNHLQGPDPLLLQWFRGVHLQGSCRNQWRGEVVSLKFGVVRAVVTVALGGGALITASFSRESMAQMSLEHGRSVILLIKSPSVQILTLEPEFVLSHENQLPGTLLRIRRDPTTVEALVELETGEWVVSTLSVTEFEDLEIAEGDRVTALFSASEVVVAASSV